MSIVLGLVTTGGALHGSIRSTPWSFTETVQTWFGVEGAAIIQGRKHIRSLEAWVLPRSYATHTLLHQDIRVMNDLIGTTGTLVWTVGADITQYNDCVFDGFQETEEPWYDGSGVNGWQVLGTMKFRQIKS